MIWLLVRSSAHTKNADGYACRAPTPKLAGAENRSEVVQQYPLGGTRPDRPERRKTSPVKGLKYLAGAGGFEPPYGGIKIRCLTAWRRPNPPRRPRAGGKRADHSSRGFALQWPRRRFRAS